MLLLADDGGSGAIAVSIDGNGRRVACDPYTGAVEAVLECARNLACVGAEPLGLTNCLNFGNPEKPHIAWQLTRAVAGLRDACLALGVPVVGGNVSLYNEGGEGPIYPTPVVGMVGKLPDPSGRAREGFARGGPRDRAGRPVRAVARGLGAGEAARPAGGRRCRRSTWRRRRTRWPRCARRSARASWRRPTTCPRAASPSRWPSAASPAGSGAADARSCSAALGEAPRRLEAERALFGEGPGGVVVAGPRAAVEALAGARPSLGEVGGEALEIEGAVSLPVDELARRLRAAIPAAFAELFARLASSGRWPHPLVPSRTVGRGSGRSCRATYRPSETAMTSRWTERDGPRDECGVFGVYAPESDVARLAYFALFALQHRGQESAGIATSDGGHIMTVRDLGLVSQVFDEQKLRALHGDMAVGHVRYSTTGSSAWENAQPVYRSDRRQVALAHNGNLINAVELHAELTAQGVTFRGTSDSEIIAALLSTHEADTIEEALADVMPRLQGAFSTVVMTKDRVRRLPRRRRPAAARRSAGSGTATASPPRAARSTSSAPSCCARCSPAR